MKKIGTVYFSNTNITHQLAEAIERGAQSNGTQTFIHRISNNDIDNGHFINETTFEQLAQCNAIAFGSPTYMGGASSQFKAFADKTGDFWTEQKWADKLAIGFTSGTGMNGDQSSTLEYFITLACQHGMLWVSLDKHDHSDGDNHNKLCLNRVNNQKGIVAYAPEGELHTSDEATAEYLGARLANFVNKL